MPHASPIAAEALERIGALYAIESEIRGRPPGERSSVRRARAGPLPESLREWLRETLALGRKNYLYCASDAGGERAAAVNRPLQFASTYRASTIFRLAVAGRRVEDYGTQEGGDPASCKICAILKAMADWLARCRLDVDR